MLAANDTDYYNVQGTMLIDPAITDDVSLVESMSNGPFRTRPLVCKQEHRLTGYSSDARLC